MLEYIISGVCWIAVGDLDVPNDESGHVGEVKVPGLSASKHCSGWLTGWPLHGEVFQVGYPHCLRLSTTTITDDVFTSHEAESRVGGKEVSMSVEVLHKGVTGCRGGGTGLMMVSSHVENATLNWR